jgi:hypothetical protein
MIRNGFGPIAKTTTFFFGRLRNIFFIQVRLKTNNNIKLIIITGLVGFLRVPTDLNIKPNRTEYTHSNP